ARLCGLSAVWFRMRGDRRSASQSRRADGTEGLIVRRAIRLGLRDGTDFTQRKQMMGARCSGKGPPRVAARNMWVLFFDGRRAPSDSGRWRFSRAAWRLRGGGRMGLVGQELFWCNEN